MRKLMLAGAAALAFQAAPAVAGSFTVTGVSVQGDNVTVSLPAANGNPAINEGVTAGPLTLTTSIGQFYAWCVDVYHAIQTGTGQSLSYQTGTVTTNNAPVPATLTSAQVTGIARLASYGGSLIGTSGGTPDTLTAVQLAIWEVEYPSFTYSGGPSQASVDAVKASASNLQPGDSGLIALSGTQTFVVGQDAIVSAGPGPSPVPEPAGAAVMAVGLLALAGMRRRA